MTYPRREPITETRESFERLQAMVATSIDRRVAAQIGHTKKSMTLDVYSHVLLDEYESG